MASDSQEVGNRCVESADIIGWDHTHLPAVGVCGFGRCGSTMIMAMLDAAGVPPCEGSLAGSYELPGLIPDCLIPGQLPGHAVKILDSILHFDLPDVPWRFIWVNRTPREQARSQVKFIKALMGNLPGLSVSALVASYARDHAVAIKSLRRLGLVLEMDYENVLHFPYAHAEQMRKFLPEFGDFDSERAMEVVHIRDGRCLPDMAVELALIKGAS